MLIQPLAPQTLCATCAVGVPLLVLGLMYINRDDVKKVMEAAKAQDGEQSATISLKGLTKSRRLSLSGAALNVQFLTKQFKNFSANCWWMSVVVLVTRLFQTFVRSQSYTSINRETAKVLMCASLLATQVTLGAVYEANRPSMLCECHHPSSDHFPTRGMALSRQFRVSYLSCCGCVSHAS